MEIKDLLDRFEILYPTIENITLLRRSYTDKDLSSIFKLINNEELRKAVVEKNLHSIFRLLTSDNETYDDLRKAVTEENLHSIFRLISLNQKNNSFDIDDLRKAVVEKNIHSIFRIVENDDLRKAVTEENLHSIFRLTPGSEEIKKLVLDDNIWSLWKLLSLEVDTSFINSFKYFNSSSIDVNKDCFTRGQLKSKLWIVNELKKIDVNLGTVFLCAGWYATLATMMFESNLKIEKIRSFDIDNSCKDIAERFNKVWEMDAWKFKASTANILDLNYNKTTYTVYKPDGSEIKLTDSPNTIINTSCEHIENFHQWYSLIPKGKLLILQNNDYFDIDDHVNCVPNLKTFSVMCPMETCLYEGELDLGKYRRFMKIGYR